MAEHSTREASSHMPSIPMIGVFWPADIHCAYLEGLRLSARSSNETKLERYEAPFRGRCWGGDPFDEDDGVAAPDDPLANVAMAGICPGRDGTTTGPPPPPLDPCDEGGTLPR